MPRTGKTILGKSFDTLSSSRKLQESGMPTKQADATVNVVADALTGLVTVEYLDGRLESLQARIDIRFERVDERFDRMDERFERIDERFERIDARFERIDARFERMDERFGQMIEQFGRMDARFEKMDTKLARWALAIVVAQSTIMTSVLLSLFAVLA